MLQRPPSRARDRDATRERRRLAKRRYRCLLAAGGKVLTLHIRDKNRLISALLNTRWLELSESEDWDVVAARTTTMLDEFAQTYGDEPLSAMDRQPVKRLPSSKS
jgi:hypothetical protein